MFMKKKDFIKYATEENLPVREYINQIESVKMYKVAMTDRSYDRKEEH